MGDLQKGRKTKCPLLFEIDKDELLASPVTVIDKEIVESGEVNGLFTTIYDAKLVSNSASELALKQFGVSDKVNENGLYTDPVYRKYDVCRYESGVNTINNYIVMNVTDLAHNVLLTFINDKFDATLKSMNIYFSDDFLKDIDIRKIITDYMNFNLTNPLYTLDLNASDDAGVMYILANQYMDSLYALLVNKVFDKYIENIVTFSFKTNSIESLYKALYEEVYKEKVKVTPDVQTCYTFCTSILREEMDKCCMQFKLALTAVAKNVAIMCNSIIADNNNDKLEKLVTGFLPEK